MDTKLSVLANASTIASNLTSITTTLETHYDTRTIRKASNKLGYAIKTIGGGRQLVNMMKLEGEDLQRAEKLINAFTNVACDDIMKGMR